MNITCGQNSMDLCLSRSFAYLYHGIRACLYLMTYLSPCYTVNTFGAGTVRHSFRYPWFLSIVMIQWGIMTCCHPPLQPHFISLLTSSSMSGYTNHLPDGSLLLLYIYTRYSFFYPEHSSPPPLPLISL